MSAEIALGLGWQYGQSGSCHHRKTSNRQRFQNHGSVPAGRSYSSPGRPLFVKISGG
jgi:hypothetical protein